MNIFIWNLIFIIIIVLFILLYKKIFYIYNQLLIYNFYIKLMKGSYKISYNLINLVIGKKIRIFMILELVKEILKKKEVKFAYFIMKKENKIEIKIIILNYILEWAINSSNLKEIKTIINKSLPFKRNFLDGYKKIIKFCEANNRLDYIKGLESLHMEELQFDIAMSYIKLGNFDDLKNIIEENQNDIENSMLVYNLFKFYKENQDIEKFKKYYLEIGKGKIKNKFEMLINIELGNLQWVNNRIEDFNLRDQIDLYFHIVREFQNSDEQDYYIDKIFNISKGIVNPIEKINLYIKLTYLTLNNKKYINENIFLEEAYKLYILYEDNNLNIAKELIILFRYYNKYDIFIELLEKKAKFYKDVLNTQKMDLIKDEFIRNINIFLWGNEFDLINDFMKSYNMVQLKDGNLEYIEFLELIKQIKRYIDFETYKKIESILSELKNKPNILFFINQYLKTIKN